MSNAQPVLAPRAAAGASGWTDERVALLTKLWAEGLSASQCAGRLGGCSRNSVIGKVTRLGLPGRAKPSQPARVAVPQAPRLVADAGDHPWRQRTAPVLKLAGNGAVFVEADARPAREAPTNRADGRGLRTVMTIAAHGECRWPIGDPSGPDFTFCGHHADGAYCGKHAARAYVSAPPSKRTGNQLARSLRRYV